MWECDVSLNKGSSAMGLVWTVVGCYARCYARCERAEGVNHRSHTHTHPMTLSDQPTLEQEPRGLSVKARPALGREGRVSSQREAHHTATPATIRSVKIGSDVLWSGRLARRIPAGFPSCTQTRAATHTSAPGLCCFLISDRAESSERSRYLTAPKRDGGHSRKRGLPITCPTHAPVRPQPLAVGDTSKMLTQDSCGL